MNTFFKQSLNLVTQTLISWNGLALSVVLGVLLGSLGTLANIMGKV
jgi:hypothetical protein